MTDQDTLIECSVHGKQPATFVCQHLVHSLRTGDKVGFNFAHDPDNPRPDAWCDACERVVMEAGGEWDDQSEEFAGVSLVCAGCYDRIKQINTAEFVCPQCGKVHGELPLDLAYLRPADVFKIPESQRGKRIRINEDLCIIDDHEFYIRGILVLPIRNTEKRFAWGVWARVSEADYQRYLKLWDVDSVEGEEPFAGKLSGGVKFYPDSDLLDVTVHLQPNNQRPLFKVISSEHLLGVDQRAGITMDKVHQFLEDFMPGFSVNQV